MLLVFIASILASAFNAGSSLLEREAAQVPDIGRLFSRELSRTISRNKKFILGIFLQLLATVMEVIALDKGSLIIVGPLLTLDLLFLWVFLSSRNKLKIQPKNWLAVSFLIVGLALLYICAHPKNDHLNYSIVPWIIAISLLILIITVALLITQSFKSKRVRATILGIATACNYALDAGLVKLCINRVKLDGFHSLFLGWPLYALLFFAALSVFMMQNTLHAGPLVISQTVIEIVQALASVLIGLFIFHDSANHSAISLVGDGLCILLIGTGVYIMASTKDLFTSKL